MISREIDDAEKWLREHDPNYYKRGVNHKDIDYPYLSYRQLSRRYEREICTGNIIELNKIA